MYRTECDRIVTNSGIDTYGVVLNSHQTDRTKTTSNRGLPLAALILNFLTRRKQRRESGKRRESARFEFCSYND